MMHLNKDTNNLLILYPIKINRTLMKYYKQLLYTCFLFLTNEALAQENFTYQLPPQSIQDLVDAPAAPSVLFNNQGTKMLILIPPNYPTIEEVSQPIVGLAGLRVNPANSSTEAEVSGLFQQISIKDVATGEEKTFEGLPANYRLGNIHWSPDGKQIAFSNTKSDGIELWFADVQSLKAQKLSNAYLNDIIGTTLQWVPDGSGILAQFIPQNRGEKPVEDPVPTGPIIQENLGKKTPARTYQYLLQNEYDQQLMDYYLTSQLQLVDLKGDMKPLGDPAIYRKSAYSPNGLFLFTEIVKKPYSYLVPINYFPYSAQILDASGELVKNLHDAPLAENLPIGFDAAAEGPRRFDWRSDVPATIYWVEALDGGDPNKKVDDRDGVYSLAAPFDGDAQQLFTLNYRFAGFTWGNANYAVVQENWRKDRTQKMTLFNPTTGKETKAIAERSSEDTYTDPGRIITSNYADHTGSMLFEKGKDPVVFTIGQGASAEGDRPFLLKWNLSSNKQDTLFKSQAPHYEEPIFFNNEGSVYFFRESVEKNPNVVALNLKTKKEEALTTFSDPYPSLQGVHKALLSYPRKDGVKLSATLYLPKGYKKEDGPLPALVWAYPREYKSLAAAGQVKGSPYRFTRLAFRSPVFWVTLGYAVLDQADMPIVGEGSKEPNDTFIEQIEDNAVALIDYVAEMGVVDRERIGVGGHSYGAFMTANLLAHTDLFAAGIARSGAYNRTLTPFGFQGESRTFWEAPDVYSKMSPFNYAHQIKKPLLLTHGMNDENSGTFPIQTERLYSAIKGHGGIVRLVLLPNEFHGYRSRESLMHTFYEQNAWLEKYVKNKGQ